MTQIEFKAIKKRFERAAVGDRWEYNEFLTHALSDMGILIWAYDRMRGKIERSSIHRRRPKVGQSRR